MGLSGKGTYRALVNPASAPKPGEGIAKTFGAISGALKDYATGVELKSAQANQDFLDSINNVDLDPTNSSMVIDQTKSMRDAYLKTKDPIEKQKILNNVSSIAEGVDQMETALEGINEDNISNAFTQSEEGIEFSRIVSDPNNIEIVDGIPGVTINGQFMDKDKLSSYIDGMKMDNSFGEVMKGLEFDQQENRKDDGDEYVFDREDVRLRVRRDITDNANLRSLFEDTLYAGRNFKKDLVESLDGLTYYDLGINDEMLKDSNVNVDDGVDVEEVEALVEYLKGNQVMLRDMLTNYYTDVLAQQFNAGKASEFSTLQQEGTDQDPEVTGITDSVEESDDDIKI